MLSLAFDIRRESIENQVSEEAVRNNKKNGQAIDVGSCLAKLTSFHADFVLMVMSRIIS